MAQNDILDDLIRHMEWADATLWRAVLEREDAELDGKLEFLLHHIHTVQHAFLRLWTGAPLEFPQAADFDDARALALWGREAHAAIQTFLAEADDAALASELVIPWEARMEERFGRAVEKVSVGQSALQVPCHSTHHRGQVMSRLRELGSEPPLVDYIAWLWFGRPAPPWPTEPAA